MEIKRNLVLTTTLPFLIVFMLLQALKQPYVGVIKAVPGQQITTSALEESLNRHAILKAFFDKHKSPLVVHIDSFLRVADKYDLDYRLLPAISCTESSCGKFLIADSHNPFGWGIYGSTVTKFSTYDEAIDKVGNGLKKGYLSRGLDTPEKIAPIYTPPSHGHWAFATRYFMNQMDKIAYNIN